MTHRPMPSQSAREFTAGLYSDGFFVTPFDPGLNCAAEIGTTNCLSDFVKVTLNGIRDTGIGTGNVAVVLQFLSTRVSIQKSKLGVSCTYPLFTGP